MSSSTTITYESMLSYLQTAEKQIDSTLDPFDCHHNYDNISDLQIYCDALSEHMCHELTRLAQPLSECTTNDTIDDSKHSLESINDNKWMTASKSQSTASFGSQSSQSAPLLTNSDNSLVNTISSTSSADHKCIYFNDNNYDISYHRLSQYENNDEIQLSLITAKHLSIIRQQMGLNINNKKNDSIYINNNNINNNSLNILSNRCFMGTNKKPKLFGCDLDNIESLSCGQTLPPFIEKCLVFLVQNAVNSIGIFRKSGVKSRIMCLKEQSEQGLEINLSDVCVYDMADVIKMWFRELKPKQLLTQQIIRLFKQNKKEFKFCAIPDTQRVVLQIILRFLALISNNSNVNQMNSHNLAICWTPSLCECPDPDQQLFDAQKCLEFCIDNCEQLFVVSINLYPIETPNDSHLPQKHESTALVECGPNDVLNRILYERQVFDPTIIEWNISEEMSPNSDTFIVRLQSSAFLPIKTITIERKWRINSLNNIEIIENGHLYQSRWSLTAQDKGVTAVAHNIAVDLRGHSYEWYITSFPTIHNKQLEVLQKSFLIDKSVSKESDV